MTSDMDIYRSAKILIDKHGADAPNGNSFEHMPESARREWTTRGKRVRASTTPGDGGAFDITEMELNEDQSVRSGPRLEHWGTRR